MILRHCPLCNQLDCCDPDCPDHILRDLVGDESWEPDTFDPKLLRDMGVGYEAETKTVPPIRRENKPQPVAKPGDF